MPCGAIKGRQVTVERSDRMWSTGEGNGKPLQYSCLENPMNSMKRQNDRILKEELPRSLKVKLLSGVRLFVTPWIVAYQAPLSMVFSRQEYWHGLPFPSPGDLPNAGIEPRSPTLEADTLTSEPPGKSIGLTMWTFVGKVMSLLFNMLSSLS